jgi:hypothetical protein
MEKDNVVIEHEKANLPVNSSNSPQSLIRLAIEKGVDTEQLSKLMDLQDRYEAKISRKAFFLALSKFQSELPIIQKQGFASFEHRNGGGGTSYDFAKLEDIASSIKPHLLPNGLSYRFEMKSENGVFAVACIVTHSEGHTEKTVMESTADSSGKKNGLQQIGSTHSYLKRYTLTAALGVIVGGEDNDAGSYEEAQKEVKFYPDEEFNKFFPKWEQLISSGKKTAEAVIANGVNRKLNFSKTQLDKINNVEVKK